MVKSILEPNPRLLLNEERFSDPRPLIPDPCFRVIYLSGWTTYAASANYAAD